VVGCWHDCLELGAVSLRLEEVVADVAVYDALAVLLHEDVTFIC